MRRIGLALALLVLSTTSAQAAETHYSIANGCFEVADGAPAGPYRLKATTLAQYLLYTKDAKYLAATADGVEAADAPSEAAEWRAAPDGDKLKLTSLSGDGRTLTLGDRVEGCAVFPEIELSVTGEPLKSRFDFGEVRGFLEGHIHTMAFEFLGGSVHCGRPWHEYGVAQALVDCIDHQPNGCGAVLENVLYGNPARCHDPVGWPTFKDWPHHKSLTHEQTYYRWLERAWMGGLRLYANLFVENAVLCELYPLKRNSCNEMESVRRQSIDIHELQDYIDAQSGGPGKGFFRIVTSPFQARRVIAGGKMAVVLGIEVSELFNCGHYNYEPNCGIADIDRQLDEVYKLGVRDLELVNKFDNALAGVAGDGGATGPVVNAGNKYDTNTFWDIDTCPAGEGDKEQPSVPRDLLIGNGLAAFLPPGATPVYGNPPHCNVRGLTSLGEYLVRRMMQRHMIVDPDHLSQAARDEVLAVTESKRYSGLISSHSWSNEQDYPRIYHSGGVVTPSDNDTLSYVKDWKRLRTQRNRRYFYGIGYGADMNGFSTSSGPREDAKNPVKYPFKSFDGGVTIDRQRSGERVFDINKDGIAHYGLFPDWIEDLRMIAGDGIVDDMANGAESYLQMWERAEGIPGPRCRSRTSRLRDTGVRRVEVGLSSAALLRRAGQPQRRKGRVWLYCLNRRALKKVRITAVLTPGGRSALVTTNARAQRAARIGTGDSIRRVRARAQELAPGLWTRPAGNGNRFVYGVRRGRVDFAAVATRAATRSPRVLRGYLRLAGVR
jgi:microsomal dipeptidase-like Zn-dependent dipeptidase